MTPEVWFSLDVEVDGPDTALNSLLSVALVEYIYDADSKRYTEGQVFTVDMKPSAGRVVNAKTLAWWHSDKGNPTEYKRLQQATTTQQQGATQVETWIKSRVGNHQKPVLIAFPTMFDGEWLDQLFVQQLGRHGPMCFQSYDIRTYASACLKVPLSTCGKQQALLSFMDPAAIHTHRAVDDAKEQGRLFCNLHAYNHGNARPFGPQGPTSRGTHYT
jgi:hypothetical protein